MTAPGQPQGGQPSEEELKRQLAEARAKWRAMGEAIARVQRANDALPPPPASVVVPEPQAPAALPTAEDLARFAAAPVPPPEPAEEAPRGTSDRHKRGEGKRRVGGQSDARARANHRLMAEARANDSAKVVVALGCALALGAFALVVVRKPESGGDAVAHHGDKTPSRPDSPAHDPAAPEPIATPPEEAPSTPHAPRLDRALEPPPATEHDSGLDHALDHAPPTWSHQPPEHEAPYEEPVVPPGGPTKKSDDAAPAVEPVKKPVPAPAEPPPAEGEPGKKPSSGHAPTPPHGNPHEVVERRDDGKVKTRYRVDKTGKKDGSYTEYHENGKVSLRATYKADLLTGTAEEFFPTGKPRAKRTYKKGVLNGRSVELDEHGRVIGDLIFVEGRLSSTKTPAQIAAAFAAIAQARIVPPSGTASRPDVTPLAWADQIKAVRRLREYRYLCDVPHTTELDYAQAERATAGAKILNMIGRLDHTPGKPPGMPEDLYKLAYEGTSRGNLAMGIGTASACVDAWMDDGDESNWRRVGHRRWCIDPSMKTSAFGMDGRFGVMFAHDGAGKTAPEVPDGLVCYPARGYFPTTHFHQGTPWSICLDPRRYGKPAEGSVKVSVRAADDKLRKGASIPLKEEVVINNDGFGAFSWGIIFRPECTTGAGSRYWVSVEGVRDQKGGGSTIEYFVEFYTP